MPGVLARRLSACRRNIEFTGDEGVVEPAAFSYARHTASIGPVMSQRRAGSHLGSAPRAWSLDTVAEYVGVTALASAALLVAGLGYTSAYLSAWRIPLSAIQLDPLSAALRSDAAIYDALLIAVVAVLSSWTLRRTHRLGRSRTAAATAVVVAVLAIAALAGFLVYWGVALAVAAGLAIGVGLQQGWLYGWRLVATFAIGALLAGYVTGYSVGLQIRDRESRQTPVVLTTAVAVGGLANGSEQGGAWHYDGLYFVYRDAGAIFVSRTGSGPVAWAIAEFNLRSVAIGTPR